MTKPGLLLAFLTICTLGWLSPAPAALIITLEESGGNVVATATGSLDLSGLDYDYSGAVSSFIYPGGGSLVMGAEPFETAWYDGGLTAWPSNFGSGGLIAPDSGAGDYFGVAPDSFYIQRGYGDGSPIYSTSTWLNASFASLGITPGSYSWTWSSDSVTLNAVPEPAVTGLVLLAFTIVLIATRQRKLPI